MITNPRMLCVYCTHATGMRGCLIGGNDPVTFKRGNHVTNVHVTNQGLLIGLEKEKGH
jgi:hypothetical protein